MGTEGRLISSLTHTHRPYFKKGGHGRRLVFSTNPLDFSSTGSVLEFFIFFFFMHFKKVGTEGG